MSIPERRLTIEFCDGQSLSFSFPIQREVPAERVSLLSRLSSSDKLMLEVEGELYIVSWNSIRYIRIDPIESDDFLPLHLLKGLRRLE
ncbi:MAG: hypothetical protein ACOVNL_06045 [Prochlorococcaceae cyanobacterium]|jgi:hypothetical protein